MPIARFPDPSEAGPEGLLAVGGDLHPRSLLLAYSQGIFPWPMQGWPLTWFCPAQRAILEFERLHVSRRLARSWKNCPYRLTIDADFGGVIGNCASVRRPDGEPVSTAGREEPFLSWITPAMREAYERLHVLGHAHSVEVWAGRRLVGGLYGVDAGGAFAGESMFHLVPNASKLALLHLMGHLKSRGLDWLDIQVMTPHMARFGARLMKRAKFLKKLKETRERGVELFPPSA